MLDPDPISTFLLDGALEPGLLGFLFWLFFEVFLTILLLYNTPWTDYLTMIMPWDYKNF